MQQHLSRRKGHIYKYHGEIRQVASSLRVQGRWKCKCLKNSERCYVLNTPSPPVEWSNIQLLHIIYRNRRHTNTRMRNATFMYPSVFCTCLKVTNDGHSFLWDSGKTCFFQRLSISSFTRKFNLYFALKFPVSQRPNCYITVECLTVAKTMHWPLKSTKHCSEDNLTLALSQVFKSYKKIIHFHLDSDRKCVCILTSQLSSLQVPSNLWKFRCLAWNLTLEGPLLQTPAP